MLSQVDASLLVSTLLALAWLRGAAREAGAAGGEAADQNLLRKLSWQVIMGIRWSEQMLPTMLAVSVASSPLAFVYSACSLGLHSEEGGWLGEHLDVSVLGRWAILLAVTVWRAEKIETLLQRLQRSFGIVKATGLGQCLKSTFSDPFGFLWPGFWGAARRFALVVVSTLGYGSFVRAALPAVVLDEFLWWALAKCQDLFARKVCAMPVAFDLIILPVFDCLHMIPVVCKVCLLGVIEYPMHDSYPLLLFACAMAWTGHNCHMVYSSMLVDLPEQASQLWAASRAG